MREKMLFTSESVSEGHPDKMADQISDAILDAVIQTDPQCRIACETLITTGLVVVAGEMTTHLTIDIQSLVRKTICEIGFDDSCKGFDYKTCAVVIAINEQSPDISRGVTKGEGLHLDQGAGDQGTMFGYACKETPLYMPLPIELSHRLMKQLSVLRKNKILDYLYPDSKCQVTIEYENNHPKRIHTIILSTQHKENISHEKIRNDMIKILIKSTCPSELLDSKTIIHINPTGRFVIGGPLGDCGLTGRKIMVDTYGGMGRHGGGCFSGKDPSKVDRTGAYMARYIAKNLVATGWVMRCEVQLSYSIGIDHPVSLDINTFDSSQISESFLKKIVQSTFELTPEAIIQNFNLLRPIYQKTSTYGHFGRSDIEFPWEKLDKVDALKQLLQKKERKVSPKKDICSFFK